MTKLILLVFLLTLQNPSPTKGQEDQPPQNQSKSEQATPKATNTQTNPLPIILDDSSPNSQQGTSDAAKQSNGKSPQYWWLSPEWIAIWVALLMVAVGIGQFIMYFCQWRIMRQSLRQATLASQKAIRHARKSSEQGLRAYLTINNKTSDSGLTEDNFFGVTITNTGDTPAHDITTTFGIRAFEGINTPWPATEQHSYDSFSSKGAVIDLGKGAEAHVMINLNNLVEPNFKNLMARWARKEVTIYYYGIFKYTDVFGKNRETSFCHVQNPIDRGTASIATDYNWIH